MYLIYLAWYLASSRHLKNVCYNCTGLFLAQIFLLCLRITYCLLNITDWIAYRNFKIIILKKKKQDWLSSHSNLLILLLALHPRSMNCHHHLHRCPGQKPGIFFHPLHPMYLGSSHTELFHFLNPACYALPPLDPLST